ncbi:MAG: pyrroloquinoline quinone biosynthesis protein C [Magnetovibrio sp.]|nr:pyrroloquinoline quinone biosynthesis protein C [Magnetovibrio sp.]
MEWKSVSKNLLSKNDLEEQLRQIGAKKYHDKHPFHLLLHGGNATQPQIQAWVLNRYCYQAAIPRKDAALLSKMADSGLRRKWRRRIEDHDGTSDQDGGIERWLILAEGVGLDRNYVSSTKGALPATKFAVEAYVDFVRNQPLFNGIASSLTELFAPGLHQERITGLLKHYEFANAKTLAYFQKRLSQAPRDVEFGLEWVLENANTPERQAGAIAALDFKCNVLWAQLDALYYAYVQPGLIPPDAWIPNS